MLIQPKKTKYRKYFKPRKSLKACNRPQKLAETGYFALIATESGFVDGRQIEAARQTIRRKAKREGRLEISILPDITITRKASAARMGKGKGKVDHWVAALTAGKTLFLLRGVSPEQGIPALKSGANKLPMKFKIKQL